MTAAQLIEAAKCAGLRLSIEGPKLVVESDGPLPETLLFQLKCHKPEVMAALTQVRTSPAAEALPPDTVASVASVVRDVPPTNEAAPCRFSDLWDTEADHARALIRYARQDGLGLTVKDGRLVISIGGKSDSDLLAELRAHEAVVIKELAIYRKSASLRLRHGASAPPFRVGSAACPMPAECAADCLAGCNQRCRRFVLALGLTAYRPRLHAWRSL
jgi:hypothetical protein